MTLRGVREDLGAIFLINVPVWLRVSVVFPAIMIAHLLGLLWMFAGAWEREAVRAEVQGDYVELRTQIAHLWGAYEMLRCAQDHRVLGTPACPRRPLQARPGQNQGKDMGKESRASLKPF